MLVQFCSGISVIVLLLREKPDVNEAETEYGVTPLFMASGEGSC